MVYNAHINTEMCNSVTAVKYIYKYVYKGHDKAVVSFVDSAKEGQPNKARDEINLFLDSRYITASKGLWRTYHYNMHSQYPSVIRLPIHLENNQIIVYDPAKITRKNIEVNSKTLLTEYFRCNSVYHEAKNLLYHEFPKHFVWKAKLKTWQPRKMYN